MKDIQYLSKEQAIQTLLEPLHNIGLGKTYKKINVVGKTRPIIKPYLEDLITTYHQEYESMTSKTLPYLTLRKDGASVGSSIIGKKLGRDVIHTYSLAQKHLKFDYVDYSWVVGTDGLSEEEVRRLVGEAQFTSDILTVVSP